MKYYSELLDEIFDTISDLEIHEEAYKFDQAAIRFDDLEVGDAFVNIVGEYFIKLCDNDMQIPNAIMLQEGQHVILNYCYVVVANDYLVKKVNSPIYDPKSWYHCGYVPKESRH